MPVRAPRRCNKCSKIAVSLGRCEDHPVKAWERPSANSRALTGAQRAVFRRKVLKAAEYTCVLCGEPATDADHIIEISDGGDPHDWIGNGQALCRSCHQRKTLAVRRARADRQRR